MVNILVVAGQGEFQRRRRPPDPFAARNETVVDLALVFLAGGEIGSVTAVIRQAQGEVAGEPIAAAREIGVAADMAVIARVQFRLARRLWAWITRDDLDDAARCIAPEQGSLGPV